MANESSGATPELARGTRALPIPISVFGLNHSRNTGLAERLLKANPDSARAARDVVMSHFKLAKFARSNGDAEASDKYARACLDLLHARITAGVTFDPPIMRLYQQLRKIYGQ